MVKSNITMSDSFYYFFSATPQVLGGILALFGVFVIFKIQTIKAELIASGQILHNRGNLLYSTGGTSIVSGTLRGKVY